MFEKFFRKYFKKYTFLIQCTVCKTKWKKNMNKVEKMIDTPTGGLNCSSFCKNCNLETEHLIKDIRINNYYIFE